MSKTLKERRIEAIDSLLKTATPSEVKYLTSLRKSYLGASAKVGSKSEPSLKEIIDRGFVGLHYFQFERDRAADGTILRSFFHNRYDDRKAKLSELISELEQDGEIYSPPEYIFESELRKYNVEVLKSQIRENESLIEIRTAWLERQGHDLSDPTLLEFRNRLHELEVELAKTITSE